MRPLELFVSSCLAFLMILPTFSIHFAIDERAAGTVVDCQKYEFLNKPTKKVCRK